MTSLVDGYKVVCDAKQYSDQMVCTRCDMAWDVNDPEMPPCPKAEELIALLATKKTWADTRSAILLGKIVYATVWGIVFLVALAFLIFMGFGALFLSFYGLFVLLEFLFPILTETKFWL